MAEQDTNVNFRVSEQLRNLFYAQCSETKEKPSIVFRRLMRDFAAGRITYSPTQSGLKRK